MKQTILTPCLLILVGFFVLDYISVIIGGSLVILGIVMLVEQKWPSDVIANKE